MSHFTTINAGLTDKQALVDGLRNLLKERGLSVSVQVHNEAMPLFNGYLEDEDEELAEVIIKRHDIGTYTDIGFKKVGEQYQAVIDPYDFPISKLGRSFRTVEGFLAEVQKAHTQAFIEREYPSDMWDMTVKTEGQKTITTLTKKVQVYI